jgi:hypothetical protein
VTITAYGGGLPWILGDALAGHYGRGPLVRALLLLLRDEEAVGSNPATPTRNRRQKPCANHFMINFIARTATKYSSSHPAPPLEGLPGRHLRMPIVRLLAAIDHVHTAGSASRSADGSRDLAG